MNKEQIFYLLSLGVITWFIIFDVKKLMLIILIMGACVGIMLLLFGLYRIYKELGDENAS